jgi:hypothetical protein
MDCLKCKFNNTLNYILYHAPIQMTSYKFNMQNTPALALIINSAKKYVAEIAIVFVYIFLLNNYIGKAPSRINSDGIGYYDYLPSLFIHHDLVRCNSPITQDSALYNRINSKGVYVGYKEFQINKYPCGAAVLELPFFMYAYLTTPLEHNYNDGYQVPFHKAIFYAAIFYAFLTLLFFKKTLQLYNVKPWAIIAIQALLILSTSLTHYLNADAGFSHIYSLFCITAFVYYSLIYFKTHTPKYIVYIAILLGFIIILRQINVLVVLALPFLAGSFHSFKTTCVKTFSYKKHLVIGAVLACCIIAIQCTVWYLQTGNFIVYSYQGESFDFSNPEFFNILFGYKKGLFVYTPILFLSVISLVWHLKTKRYYFVLSWLVFFSILTYVLSSWWSWYYGCSFGLRAYIDYYTLLFIPMAIWLSNIRLTFAIPIVVVVGGITSYINIVQTYQYKEYFLHWIDMDKAKFWELFLKTDDNYRGLLWKIPIDENNYNVNKEINLGNVFIDKSISGAPILNLPTDSIPNFATVSSIVFQFDNHFYSTSPTQITASIREGDHFYYWNKRSLLQFRETQLNEWHTGKFNFDFPPITNSHNAQIVIIFETTDYDNLNNAKIRFLSPK